MNRQQFNSRNNISKIMTIQKSGSTTSFDPTVSFSNTDRRALWKLFNGSETILLGAATSGPNVGGIIYTGFTSDTAIRDIELRFYNADSLNFFGINSDNVYGTINLAPFTSTTLNNTINLTSNPNLNYVLNIPKKTNVFYVNSCNILGNITCPSENLAIFNVSSNSNLTGITHSVSSGPTYQYFANNCNLNGELDLTLLSDMGGVFRIYQNSSLTGITHTASTQNFSNYEVYNCNLIGTLNLSMFTNFGGASSASTCCVKTYSNSNLTNILFPNVTTFFRNLSNAESNGAFGLYLCDLNYVDFKPLSGATLVGAVIQGDPRISLRDNNMSAGDVNHILDDFKYNATNNSTGWSNVNLNIGGTNANPDSSSGGYDGLAAIAFLTGSPYNWTITY